MSFSIGSKGKTYSIKLKQKRCQTYGKIDKKRPSLVLEGLEYQINASLLTIKAISDGDYAIFQQTSQLRFFLLLQ